MITAFSVIAATLVLSSLGLLSFCGIYVASSSRERYTHALTGLCCLLTAVGLLTVVLAPSIRQPAAPFSRMPSPAVQSSEVPAR